MEASIAASYVLLLLSFGAATSEKSAVLTKYDRLVLSDKPVGYWLLRKGDQADAAGHRMAGTYHGGARGQATLPDGETASTFNGLDSYFEIPNNAYLQLTRTGILTIEAWMCPAAYDYPKTEGDGYVYWMGQGTPGNYVWSARMYNRSAATRSQRISSYCFNVSGGLGAGSYFQDAIPTGTWVHYVLVINTRKTSVTYPTGYTKIYRDSVLRDTDSLQGYTIVPGKSKAPLRVATRDLHSFFKGSIGKVAVYDYELTPSQLLAHNNTMWGL